MRRLLDLLAAFVGLPVLSWIAYQEGMWPASAFFLGLSLWCVVVEIDHHFRS